MHPIYSAIIAVLISNLFDCRCQKQVKTTNTKGKKQKSIF